MKSRGGNGLSELQYKTKQTLHLNREAQWNDQFVLNGNYYNVRS
jgi:hypothetical protein